MTPLLLRVLSLAPASFRQRYERELLSTYEERERAAAARGELTAFRIRELLGAVALVIRLRMGLGGRAGGGRRGPDDGGPIRSTWQDVRFGLRTVRRNPAFSTMVVGVLALGIGATSAVFSAVNAYFFRPLPFTEPERLVTVYETNPEFGWVDATAAPANLLDWREQVDAFADVSGYSEATDELTTFQDGEPFLATGSEVMGNFFSTLGVRAALGRTFRMEETWLGQDDVVVLSHDLWVSRFAADPEIVGKVLQFAGHAPEILGVMPPGFRFPDRDVELWYPMGLDPADVAAPYFRRAHYVRAFARLASAVSLEEAEAQLQVVVRRLQQEYPSTNAVMGAGIVPMRDFLVRDVRTPLRVLLGAVVFLLLLACTNVANLVLVRAGERAGEVSLRRALGASRVRLARQMLVESVTLALAGGALGLGIGWLAVRALAASTPIGIDGATSLTLDHRVVFVTFATAALCGLAFGMLPVVHGGRELSHRPLRDDARRATAGRRGLRAAGVLVSVQIALALLLVVGSGLMIRTFWLLRQVDPGFRTDGVLAVQFAVQTPRYPAREDVLSFYDRFTESLEARPGVERVGVVARLPLDGPSWTSQLTAEGWPPDRTGFEILHRRADRGYFEALEIPLIEGRWYDEGGRLAAPSPDASASPPVVLVNEAFVREHFPGESPVGRRITFSRDPGPDATWLEIIGVVGDQQQESLARPARPEVFESREQDWGRNDWVVVRGDGDLRELEAAVRAVLAELDPLIPLARVRPLESVRSESLGNEQMVLMLLSAFGGVALLLAAVGIYGVTSRAARRRTREIGVRMALGARGGDVVLMVLRQALAVVALGIAGGLLASAVTTRALGALLYGVDPLDPLTLGTVVALLGGIALLACYVPARRAVASDPLGALRSE